MEIVSVNDLDFELFGNKILKYTTGISLSQASNDLISWC